MLEPEKYCGRQATILTNPTHGVDTSCDNAARQSSVQRHTDCHYINRLSLNSRQTMQNKGLCQHLNH